MSRAFVKETDDIEPLPERPVSPYPNYVTAQGLAQIDAELAQFAEGYARAQIADDRDAFWLRALGPDGPPRPSLARIPVGLSMLTAADLDDPHSSHRLLRQITSLMTITKT